MKRPSQRPWFGRRESVPVASATGVYQPDLDPGLTLLRALPGTSFCIVAAAIRSRQGKSRAFCRVVKTAFKRTIRSRQGKMRRLLPGGPGRSRADHSIPAGQNASHAAAVANHHWALESNMVAQGRMRATRLGSPKATKYETRLAAGIRSTATKVSPFDPSRERP